MMKPFCLTVREREERDPAFKDALALEQRGKLPKLLLSFSGGRTSAYMTWRLLRERNLAHDMRVIFANTGLEDERTLRFVDNCDKHLGFGTIWIEAVHNAKRGSGVAAKQVTFETAARKGEPFEGMIAKHGIPNRNFPHCTRETKTRPLRAWLRENGWRTGSYDTAIGIRADEQDRVPEEYRRKAERAIYPLIGWNIKKPDILRFWEQQPFDLGLPEEYGNCVTCWKKSLAKLVSVARRNPEAFDFMDRMERTYPFVGPKPESGPFRFFRENRTVQDILALAAIPESEQLDLFVMNEPGGCGESCEVLADLVA